MEVCLHLARLVVSIVSYCREGGLQLVKAHKLEISAVIRKYSDFMLVIAKKPDQEAICRKVLQTLLDILNT